MKSLASGTSHAGQSRRNKEKHGATGIARDLAMINDSSPVLGLIDLWMTMGLWMLAEGQKNELSPTVYLTQSSVLRTETDLDRSGF